MARSAEKTRRRILDTAHELFYRKGFTRVGVDEIADSAGITKRSLYYHFDSKDRLLAAVLETYHELALARIQKWGVSLSSDLDAMIDTLFAELARWASRPRFTGAGFTRLVMELADLPGHPARAVARRHKAAVEAWFASELAKKSITKPNELARLVLLLVEGATSLMLIHGDRRYAQAAAEAAKRLVRDEGESSKHR
jgi:AcrR family transcriptional regulator